MINFPLRRTAATALMVPVLLLSACGQDDKQSTGGPQLPPAAEPAVAPRPAANPPGQIIAVGDGPEGIVADSDTRTVAVGVRNPSALVLIDADTGAIRTRTPLPGVLRHLQLAAPGGPVLVPDETANGLIRVGLPGGQQLAAVPTGRGAHDASQAPNGNIFVANENGASVSVVKDDKVIKNFDGVTQPAGLAPVGNVMGLIDVRENTITFYDSEKLTTLAELPAGAGPTHLVADKHGRMIATDTRGGALYVYDASGQPRQVAKVDVPGEPYGITYDAQRDRLWVTTTANNEVIGFDMANATPREVARFQTAWQPNTVAVDAKTGKLFITGTNAGAVQVINAG